MVLEVHQLSIPTWVKICGIKDPVILESLCALKPDAVGFNFYEKSVRYVRPDIAKEFVNQLTSDILPVGLFVNHQVDEIRAICDLTGITTIQLHGDELPEMIAQLSDYRVIRAVRLSVDFRLRELIEEDQRLREVGVRPFAYLLDKRSSTGYGGTGERLQWDMLVDEYDKKKFPRMILAGGLSVQNVQEAIRVVKPFGVDVASGVEQSPGIKSIEACKKFLEEVRVGL